MLGLKLAHWGRVTHICVGETTMIGSNNGLWPGRRQAIIWTNAGILLIGPLGTNFIEILIGIQTFSFNKMHLKMSSAKWRPFCLGLNVLNHASKRVPASPASSASHGTNYRSLSFMMKRIWTACAMKMSTIDRLSKHYFMFSLKQISAYRG